MHCPHCHQEHPEDTRFCSSTGKEIIKPLACPKCGKSIESIWLFCNHCGLSLRPAEGKSDQHEMPVRDEVQTPKPNLSSLTPRGKPIKITCVMFAAIISSLLIIEILAVILFTVIWRNSNKSRLVSSATNTSAEIKATKTTFTPIASNIPKSSNTPSATNFPSVTIIPTLTVIPRPFIKETGKIVFEANRDGNTEIYKMNDDGSAQTRLTNNSTGDGFPIWSPDGKKIAFTSERDGNAEIYIMNADGSAQTRITKNSAKDGSPTWSPDKKRIAFTSNRDGNFEIYVMNVDGSNQIRLTNNSTDDGVPIWSPDGKKIAFTSTRDGNLEIYLMSTNGKDQTRLTNNLAVDVFPDWSPDGTQIAFTSTREGNEKIYVMNADGSEITRLTNNPAADAIPCWSTTGKIFFTSKRDGNDEIYVMNADGSQQTRITNNQTPNANPSWTANAAPIAISPTPTRVKPTITIVPQTKAPISSTTPHSGSLLIEEKGWIEYFASGSVSTGQDGKTQLEQVALFHGPSSQGNGFSCQGCYVLETLPNTEFHVPVDDKNGSSVVFRAGESYQYLIKGTLSAKTYDDFFLGSLPIIQLTYLERVK